MTYSFRKLYEYEGNMMSFSEIISQNWKTLLLMLLIAVAACFKLVFQIYLSISVGSLVPRHHSLISILAFIGTEIVTGMCRKVMHITGALKFSIFSAEEEITVNGSSDLSPESAAAAILFYAAFSIIFFLITRWLLKKHMNLE